MTDGQKATETLVWIYDKIMDLPNRDWNNSSVLYEILDKTENTLKGMENGKQLLYRAKQH